MFTVRTGYTPPHAPSGYSYAPAVSPPPPQYVGGGYDIPSVSPQGLSPSSTYYSPSTVLSYQSRGKLRHILWRNNNLKLACQNLPNQEQELLC